VTCNLRLGTIKRHRAIAFILATFIALGVTYSVVTPIFEASDELWHYLFVKHLADGNGLPVQDPDADQPWRQEGSQPPLYYALGALATFWIDTDDAYEGYTPLLWYNPHVDNGVLTADGNTNLVVHSQQEAFPWHGTALAVHLLRLLSVLMGAATVLLTYLIALEVFPGREDLALGAAAVNAFTPMFLFISGAVNNDNLVVPLCSLALLMMLKISNIQYPISNHNWVLDIRYWILGLVLGLAALTKESALGLFPLALLAVAARIWQQHRALSPSTSSGQRLSKGRNAPLLKRFGLVIGHWSLIILPALAVSGWWYWRNWCLYGDPLGLNVFLDILGRRHPPATLRQLWGEREGFAMSYWGLFGGVNVPLDTWVYRLLNLLAIIAALGIIIFLIRKFRARLRPEAWVKVVILLAWPAIVFTSLIRWALQTWSSQGRLVFSAISALSILLFLGLSQFVPRRYTKTLACLLGGLMFIIAAIAPFRHIAPAYAKPHLLSAEEIEHIPNRLDISFGGVMKLLGYDLPVTNTQYPVSSNLKPGDALTVTLYWQSLAEMNQDYSTFVHLLDGNELIVAQRDMYPGQGLYPTSLWSAGDAIANRYVLILPETAFTPNQAQLEVGLYNFTTGERLLAYRPNGEPLGDNVRFQEIEILPRAEAEVPNPVNFNFGNRIALIGYDMDRRTAAPGETIHLTLYWQALAKMKENYSVFTHVLGEENRIWAQKDSWPKGGDAPTSTWEPGQTIADEYELVIHPDTPPDVYEVEIGLYLAATGDRLRIVGQGGRLLDDRVLLSKVRVK